MCDLWKNTLEETVPLGAIPKQIDYTLARLPAARQIKLYNSGSFFDRGAIPIEDQATIAKQIGSFERVIIECHPALVDERVLCFRDLLQGQLEIAMGLETAHPETLARLNKRMTIEDFSRAAEFLRNQGIALRVFILVKPHFKMTWRPGRGVPDLSSWLLIAGHGRFADSHPAGQRCTRCFVAAGAIH